MHWVPRMDRMDRMHWMPRMHWVPRMDRMHWMDQMHRTTPVPAILPLHLALHRKKEIEAGKSAWQKLEHGTSFGPAVRF